MFESLSTKPDGIFKNCEATEADRAEYPRCSKRGESRPPEADVNFKVVKDFIQSVQTRAVGQEVMASLTPCPTADQDCERRDDFPYGSDEEGFTPQESPPYRSCWWGFMDAEKQRRQPNWQNILGRRKTPYLIPADVYRPAAIDQSAKAGPGTGN
jgi:signal recognition particle subunit SRP54